jgi:hypothetical protein
MIEDETGDESHRLFSIGTIEIVSSGSGPLRFQRASPVDRRHFHRAASVQSVGLSRAIAAGYLSDEADFREIRNDQERSALIGDNLVGFRSHAASVPSIGGSSLQAALARVRGAEQALTVAREEARAAARRAAVSLSGLFSDTEYVPRNTADRWVSEARLDGANAVEHLAKRLKREGLHQRAGDSHKVAEQILAAGRRAGSDGSNERPMPPRDSVAGKILAAGRRARTPTGSDQE